MKKCIWTCCVKVFSVFLLFIDFSYGLAVPDASSLHTCIIGSGISGLASARYLQELGVKDFVVLEAATHYGGIWRFEPRIGEDENGIPVHSSMYKYLRTNTPRQTMEFANYSFPDGTPTYPTGTCYYKYIKAFVRDFGLEKYIQLKSLVIQVKWSKDHWTISYLESDTKQKHTVDCGHVIVATGHEIKPKLPHIEGQEEFRGKIIHSHDYKQPETFTNRRVLLVGAGPSGLDLAIHLSNITSKLVHSHHREYNQPKFSDTYVKKPDIAKLTSHGVVFVDGSFEEVDDVILCTGFEYSHPFLDPSCGVTATTQFVLPLYNYVVNIKRPTMSVLGVSKKISTRVLDSQAEYAARVAAGAAKLPSQERMLKEWLTHVYRHRDQGIRINDVNAIGNDQADYFRNLTAEAGVTPTPPVITKIKDFNIKIRLEDLLNYRDYDFDIIDDNNFKRYYNKREGDDCPYEDDDDVVDDYLNNDNL